MDRFVLSGIAVIVTGIVAGALWAPVLFFQDAPGQTDPQARNNPGDEPGGFELGSTHEHAYLLFYVNGTSPELNESYLNNVPHTHFHNPDGVIHVHAQGVTVRDALTASRIEVTNECITFVPDNTSHCGNVTVLIDGDPHTLSEVLDREIVQGQTITITTEATVPDEFQHRRLPEQYRVGGQGA